MTKGIIFLLPKEKVGVARDRMILKNILLISTAILINTDAKECGEELCVNLCCPKDHLIGDIGVNKCDSRPRGSKGCIAGDPKQV